MKNWRRYPLSERMACALCYAEFDEKVGFNPMDADEYWAGVSQETKTLFRKAANAALDVLNKSIEARP
jgi:hypothetical protein